MIDRIRPLIEAFPYLVKMKMLNDRGIYADTLPLTIVIRRSGSLELINCLVESWPESIREKNNDGLMILHSVVRSSPLAVVEFLVDQWPESVKERTKDGDLSLHYAVSGTYVRLDVVAFLVDQWKGSLSVSNERGSFLFKKSYHVF